VKSGFIKKPVSGRGGQSMELLDAKGNLIEKSEGQFG
jgi:glutathionylspermidine synthase